MKDNAALKSILLLAANPKNTVSLRLQEEEREIKERLRIAGYGKVPVSSTGATRSRDIQQAMLDYEPQIVHFTGHGMGEDGLAFEDGTGQLKLVNSEALANLFKLFAERVECVVLNACYSKFQAEAIAQHIDYVIGMSQAIGDDAAIEFSVGFYTALGAGGSVEFAFEMGCNAIQLADFPGHLTPVLYVKKSLQSQHPLNEDRGGSSRRPEDLPKTISEKITEEKKKRKQIKILRGSEEELKEVTDKIRRLERERGKNPELEKGYLLSERYELLEKIDSGGFATVWKAYDENEDGHGVVAVKILHGHYAKDESQRDYFFRGARTMSELHHSNIVRIIESEAKHDKYFYFVMEFIDGKNLEQAILDKENPLSDDDFTEKILRDIESALVYAHSKKCIHRDIKPQNILIDKSNTAYLADFNLLLMKSGSARMATGAIGSFIYTSPEALGYHEVDKTSDIYSLGMTTIFSLYKKTLPPDIFRDSYEFIDRELDCTPSIKSALIKAVEFKSSQRFENVKDFYVDFSNAWKERKEQLIAIIPSRQLQETLSLEPYWIGRFTVTNTEYGKFVRDNGYSSEGLRRWWSELGQEVWKIYQDRGEHPHIHRMRRNDEFTDHPLTWNDKTFNHPAQPVVGVCWYEAEAYCNWLTERLREQNPQKWLSKVVTLPTEKQWEYAARGESNYLYPWGNSQPTEKLANFNTRSGKPNVVGAYPDGVSWCGCHDMAGNVLEWCRDYYGDGLESIPGVDRTIRGGCCYDNNLEEKFSITVMNRRARKPGYRHSAMGFRIVIESLSNRS